MVVQDSFWYLYSSNILSRPSSYMQPSTPYRSTFDTCYSALDRAADASPALSLNLRDTGVTLVVTTLVAANADHLSHLPPETSWGVEEGSLVGIDGRALPDQVDLVGADDLGLVDDLPADVQDHDEDLHGVVLEEG